MESKGIAVAIASHKGRKKHLINSVESLLECNTKPDVIYVYLNDYDTIPKRLERDGVRVVLGSQADGDLGASAKFYFTQFHSGVYLTCDDDLLYNKAYIGYLSDKVYQYGNKCLIGLHGSKYLSHPVESYYKSQRVIHYLWAGLAEDQCIDLIGSGTMAHDTRFITITHKTLPERNMTDPQICRFAKTNGIPMYSLQREHGFVKEQRGSQDNAIWKGLHEDDSKQTQIINETPWTRHTFVPIKMSDFGRASIEWGHYKYIIDNADKGKTVLFGNGRTTKYFKSVLDVTCVEHDEQWVDGADIIAPLKDGWYDGLKKKDVKTKVSNYIIDAPVGKDRLNILDHLDVLNQRATFFIDDCQRDIDMMVATRIAEEFGKEIEIFKSGEKIMAKLY